MLKTLTKWFLACIKISTQKTGFVKKKKVSTGDFFKSKNNTTPGNQKTVMISPGSSDTFFHPSQYPQGRRTVVFKTPEEEEEEAAMMEGEGEGEEREYRSRKPWKWLRKKKREERGYNAPYYGQTGPSYYRPGPTGRRGRAYAGEEIDEYDHEYFSEDEEDDERTIGERRDYEFYDSDEEGQMDSEDEEEFQDRMYAGEKEYRIINDRKKKSRRPSLYSPLDAGDDCPQEGLGRLVSTKYSGSSEKFSSSDAVSTAQRTKVIEDAHRALRAKYAASRPSDYRMSEKKAASIKPVSIKASVSDQMIKEPNKVIVVNEDRFDSFQRTRYNRSDDMIKKFKANAIEHMRGLLGFDFSRVRNPDVQKKGSVLTIGDKVRLAPYILGGKGSVDIKVTQSSGFPSLKIDDQVIDSGFVFSVISEDGVTVHGKYGGKEGKPLTKGQSFYYGEMMIKTPRDVRKPEWIRAVSMAPSMITEKNTSRAEMKLRRTSLFEPSAGTAKTYTGQATRILKIERMTDAQGRTAKKVNSIYEINF